MRGLTGMGQGIDQRDARSALGREHVRHAGLPIQARAHRLRTQVQHQLVAATLGSQGLGSLLSQGQQQTAPAVGELGMQRLARDIESKTTLRQAMRAPAVAAAEGVVTRQGLLGLQHMRHHRRHGQWSAHALLVEEAIGFARNQRGVQPRQGKGLGGQHMAQELHIGGQAHDVQLAQGLVQPGQGLFARVAVHDELGDHGVVEGADGIALAHAVVDAHHAGLEARGGGLGVDLQRAGGGQELVVGVLGADARLDGMAAQRDLVLRERQWLARGHAQLPFHEVQAGDGLGDRVLHLQARVHLHEVKAGSPHAVPLVRLACPCRGGPALGRPGGGIFTALQALDDELHRARTHIAHGLGGGHGGLAHLPAQVLTHAGRGRFFQHLLVAALHRAVALVQVHTLAVRIGEDLDLDVARALHVLFNQHRVVAKAIDGFALAAGQGLGKVACLLDRAHALATAAGAGLDEHRVTDAIGLVPEHGGVLVGAVVTGHQGHAGFFHELLGLGLQAHGLDGRGRRADEHQARVGAGLSKLFVLAQKAIAGMDGLRARGLGCLDDALPAQVAVLGGTAANMHRLVAGGHMLGLRICI